VRFGNEKLIIRSNKYCFITYRKACLKVCQDCCTVFLSALAVGSNVASVLVSCSLAGLAGGVLTVVLEAVG